MPDPKNFAIGLAKKAGEIIRSNFRLGVERSWKRDDTPLTATDLAVNRLVINSLRKAFPDHSILAEEGSSQRKSRLVWVCDPLDGTVPFSHGYPTFVFSLALVVDGRPQLGVIYDPFLDRLAVAQVGKGSVLNGKSITVSRQRNLKNAFVQLDTDFRLIRLREALIEKGAFTATLYSSVYGSFLVACGEAVAEIYEYTNAWDGAAVKVIVEEAGGKVTDLFGRDQRYDRPLNGFVASNGLIHQELIQLVGRFKP